MGSVNILISSENILKGKVPYYFSLHFTDIVKRCQLILGHRPPQEIDDIMLDSMVLTNLLFDEDQPELPDDPPRVTRLADFLKGEPTFERLQPNATKAARLFQRRHEISLDDRPGMTWSEIFAGLALAMTSNAIGHESLTKDANEHVKEIIQYIIGELAVDAIQAVVYAELIPRLDQHPLAVEEQVKKTISLRAAKAAQARYERPNAIKQRFIEFYFKGTFRSHNDAARRYYRGLSVEERRILSPSGDERNAIRTLTTFLRLSSSEKESPT